MRSFTPVLASLALFTSSVAVAAASHVQPDPGLLVGQTQISYGCPGPARVGQPSCESWHPFPHARFGIRQVGPTGRPLPQVIRVVVSDRLGRFAVRLSSGDYQVTPAVQDHTTGGRRLTIHIRSGQTTRILVRFNGFPRMV
jgi:hypothetical protein